MITILSKKIAYYLVSASNTEPESDQIDVYIWIRVFSEYWIYYSHSGYLGITYKYSFRILLLDCCFFNFTSSFWWITCSNTFFLYTKQLPFGYIQLAHHKKYHLQSNYISHRISLLYYCVYSVCSNRFFQI